MATSLLLSSNGEVGLEVCAQWGGIAVFDLPATLNMIVTTLITKRLGFDSRQARLIARPYATHF